MNHGEAGKHGPAKVEPRRGASPVLGSVMEQFGKLREQRSLNRSNSQMHDQRKVQCRATQRDFDNAMANFRRIPRLGEPFRLQRAHGWCALAVLAAGLWWHICGVVGVGSAVLVAAGLDRMGDRRRCRRVSRT